MVATMAYCAGAPRKAILFLSSIIVFTEALIWSDSAIGDLEDMDACIILSGLLGYLSMRIECILIG